MDEATARNARPATRLHGAADFERELAIMDPPAIGFDALFARQAPQVAVRADVVEAMIVHAHMREVWRHPRQRALLAKLEERIVTGRVELQQRGAVDETFRPLRPATSAVASVDGEHRRAAGRPCLIERSDLHRRQLEHAIDGGHEIASRPGAIETNHERQMLPDPLTSVWPRRNLAISHDPNDLFHSPDPLWCGLARGRHAEAHAGWLRDRTGR